MPRFIDVEVCIDTVTLLTNYPNPSKDPNNPTGIDHTSYSYMIAQPVYVTSGQATGNLTLKALVGDVIQWRMISLSGNSDQAAVIYGVPQFGGSTVTGAVIGNVAQPYEPIATLQPDGENYNPPRYESVSQFDYFLQANITGHGSEQYKVCFYVTTPDPNTGKPVVKGYFNWDPTITVP